MNIKKANHVFLFFFIFLSSCKTISVSIPFIESEIPQKPDFSKSKFWAVLPGNYPDELKEISGPYINKKADVFFIYPTTLVDPKIKNWNADISNIEIRRQILTKAVKYQASCFTEAGNLYVPFYRQAHYRSFDQKYSKVEGPKSWRIAYEDIRNSFEYYLQNFNNGKPIIIASHSQGSLMARELLKDYFDGKPLQRLLVAAYIPGIKIVDNDFKEIKQMTTPDEIGGFLSWNTFKINKIPKKYNQWFKGGVTTNPITWDSQKKTTFNQHLGLLYIDDKIYPNSIEIELINGLVWSTVPKVPKRFFVSFKKNYHFADINLFWLDIKKNSILRVEKWSQLNKR